ncbi:7171_t:CDS:1, partial [Funneliformis caledonium]
ATGHSRFARKWANSMELRFTTQLFNSIKIAIARVMSAWMSKTLGGLHRSPSTELPLVIAGLLENGPTRQS